jgi:hypothetical protein
MANVFAALRSNESCQEIYPRAEPKPEPSSDLDCRGCNHHARDWCILFPEKWLNCALLAACPRDGAAIKLKPLTSKAPQDEYSKIFSEACESLSDYPQNLMEDLRAENPELAERIDAAYDEINARWGGDLDRFKGAVSGWAGLVGAGIACVRNRTPPRLAVESAEQVYTTGDI